jgi:hypothetical protein
MLFPELLNGLLRGRRRTTRLVDFLMSNELTVASLINSVEIGRQMQRHERQRFTEFFYGLLRPCGKPEQVIITT